VYYLVEYVKNLTMHLQFAVVERKEVLCYFLWGVLSLCKNVAVILR